jgi:hypothetical protein
MITQLPANGIMQSITPLMILMKVGAKTLDGFDDKFVA